MKKGWFSEKPVHRLYITCELTNQEKFVLENRKELFSLDIVKNWKVAYLLFDVKQDREGRIKSFDLTPQRRMFCEFTSIHDTNRFEEKLREGLAKFKQVLDNEATYFEKRPEKKSYEL